MKADAGASLKTMEIPAGLNVMEDGKPFFFPGGKVGCLLIHGFTGTTSSMKPMGEDLAERGLTVLGPRLPGHGTDVRDMALHPRSEWIDTVETAFEEISSICESVFVSGLSMGGALTLFLGEKHPDKVTGLIPIDAAAPEVTKGLQKHALKLLPVLKHVVKVLPGPGNDLKDPNITETAYDSLSTESLYELVKLAAEVKGELNKIKSPIRIFVACNDHVVPTSNADYIFDHVSSTDKEVIWLDNCFHVATLDVDRGKIFRDSYAFIQKLTA